MRVFLLDSEAKHAVIIQVQLPDIQPLDKTKNAWVKQPGGDPTGSFQRWAKPSQHYCLNLKLPFDFLYRVRGRESLHGSICPPRRNCSTSGSAQSHGLPSPRASLAVSHQNQVKQSTLSCTFRGWLHGWDCSLTFINSGSDGGSYESLSAQGSLQQAAHGNTRVS